MFLLRSWWHALPHKCKVGIKALGIVALAGVIWLGYLVGMAALLSFHLSPPAVGSLFSGLVALVLLIGLLSLYFQSEGNKLARQVQLLENKLKILELLRENFRRRSEAMRNMRAQKLIWETIERKLTDGANSEAIDSLYSQLRNMPTSSDELLHFLSFEPKITEDTVSSLISHEQSVDFGAVAAEGRGGAGHLQSQQASIKNLLARINEALEVVEDVDGAHVKSLAEIRQLEEDVKQLRLHVTQQPASQ